MMNEPLRIAFNLAVNATGSFVIAAGLVWLVSKVLRPRAGRVAQSLLVLPLVKVVYDIARGIPEESFFWQTLVGARQDLGTFQIGLGISSGLPVINLSLGALRGGAVWPQSLAEPVATGLVLRVSPAAPAAIALALLTVSALLMAKRAFATAGALRLARDLRREATLIETLPLGLRAVDVVVSARHHGAPFAGGLVRPFVCFSAEAYAALDDDERAAVIGHELGHLRHHDLLTFGVLAILADLLWFVPGLRARCRTLCAHAEIAADDAALARGASPLALASALVRVGDLCARASASAPMLSLVAGAEPASWLAQRVSALLSAEPRVAAPSVRDRLAAVARFAAIALTFVVVLSAATLGNH